MKDGANIASIRFTNNCDNDVPLKHKCNCSITDTDNDVFEIVTGVLQGNTLATHFFIICLDYVLRMSIDLIKINGHILKKKQMVSR